MWKTNPTATPSISPAPENPRPAPAFQSTNLRQASAIDQNSIGKGFVIKGDITGTESLFIDASLEGSVTIPGCHITVGRNGQITGNVEARDVVVMGKICGDVTASNRVDVRAEGTVTGDVTACRMSIAEGAYCKGRMDIQVPAMRLEAPERPTAIGLEPLKIHRVVQPEAGKLHMDPLQKSA